MRHVLAALVIAIATLESLHAAYPRLRQIEPQGAQRGIESTVILRGDRVGKEPREILWHDPGIEVRELKAIDDNQVEARLFLPEDCPLGIHALRVRTASGLTNLMTLHVGTLPEVAEVEPNNAPDQAQKIKLGSVVNGVVQFEDVDFYSIDVKQGERLSVEIEGFRLGRTFFDPVLILWDAEGNEVATCDDLPICRQDAALSIVATQDQTYTLEVRESAYRGNGDSTYRLHVGTFPRPAAVYPPGGKAGETVSLRWIGAGVEGATSQVALPGERTDIFPYFPTDDRGAAPSPHPLRVVDLPVTEEVEPNNGRKQATPATAPGVMCGIIQEDEDRDFFKFSATKGQILYVRLHGRSIGSPLDSVMRISKAEGGSIAGNDDDQGRPDSFIRFQAPDDGEYLLEVTDHLKRGAADFIYWVELTTPEPLVELSFGEERQYEANLIEVPQGNRYAVTMRAVRRDMGGDPLAFEWRDLPAGVSAEFFPLAGNYDQVPVVLHAAEDAPLGQGLATIACRKTDGDTPLLAQFSQRNWLIRGQNNRDMWNYMGDRPAVAVTQAAPFTIEIVEPKAPLVQRGTKNLKIVAHRREGFEEAIQVRLLYHSPGVSSNRSLRIKQKENEVEIPVTANPDARIGEWKIAVRGEANVDGPLVVSTQFATLKVVTPYVAMTWATATMEQGTTIQLPVTVEQLTPFEGEAKVELIGLPPGVTAEPVQITKETEEFAFELVATADARVGQHRGLFCQVTHMEQGEPVVQSVGGGELRVDAPIPPA